MKKYKLERVDRSQPKPKIKVFIQPCNEGQEMNYCERYSGEATEIIAHSIRIIQGLKSLLTNGTFSIKIESENLEECVYVDENFIYDFAFEIIANLNEAHLFLA